MWNARDAGDIRATRQCDLDCVQALRNYREILSVEQTKQVMSRSLVTLHVLMVRLEKETEHTQTHTERERERQTDRQTERNKEISIGILGLSKMMCLFPASSSASDLLMII